MADPRYIAGLVGPALVVITASEITNPDVWRSVSAPETYQAGTMAFVAGLSIIRAHNRWVLDWTAVITLLGWFAIIAGMGRMFFTHAAMQGSQNPSVAFAMEVLLLLAGLFLCLKGFTQRS